ncbi:ribbon-helix-helix protein, CopG family [Candidatus Poribacteria bacterium]|nr:ribbon-helix-helix protein, CopG family [Candidatus Poribacteria bacterium]
MRSVLTISLNEELKEDLDRFAKISKTNRSEIVKKALSQYLYLKKVKNTRKKLRPHAESKGFYTDEDIYSIIS